jgi:hypothetical protein
MCHISLVATPQLYAERKINEVPISIENIEQALLVFAIPGMWGSVRIRLKLLPTAGQEVMLGIEHRTVTRLDVAKSEQHIIASNERYNRVRECLAEKAHEFRVICPIVEIVGHFQDGKMSSLETGRTNERLA